MKTRLAVLILTICLPIGAFAHVGSPGVSFEGSAGQFPVMALINPPDVIPGTATVDIFTNASGVNTVLAKPVYWFAGADGTPQADEMLPVPGEPGHYRGVIWLMDVGTSGIAVEIKGKAGSGDVIIPVMAVSTTQKKMDGSLGWSLAALATLLVVLMVTIISVSVSDGLLRPDDPSVMAIRRKRRVGALAGTVLLLLMLWGGKAWWDGWATTYERYMFKPFNAVTRVETEGAEKLLVFAVDTTKLTNLRFTRNISYIIPDHGKLMHLFLVKANTLDVFAHLHPKRRDSVTFVAPLPPLPPGQYLVFADVTRVSGFSETIPDTLDIPEQQAVTVALRDSVPSDPDNTYFFTNAIDARKTSTPLPANEVICGKPGVRVPLGDALTVTWQHNPTERLLSRSLYSLKFEVQDTTGKPATLEPYLGMMGHAVVMKDDGSVYIHLHPVGSYSMASQQTMLKRFSTEHGPVNVDKMPPPKVFRDSVDRELTRLEAMTEAERNTLFGGGMQHESDTTHAGHTVVSFPYSFPSPGNYRIWIQMKHEGKILNSAFDATVE
ncbi:hypothetical protein [Chryseolinea lacunae]|uniref:Uncharacterized protein n=1 Tax=Chryseolinea lacunae TaxID=2801331 RepID=A0ABS1KZ39_9BACT|nr:hypothetical protein [Chryseolinea lacunae]MBL0744719.1 hypothetical protein [Chryseolinea lacunae]